MNLEYFKIAFRNVKRRRLRSSLTILGIIISIAIIFVLASLSLGLQEGVKEQFRQFGTDKFFIMPSGQLAGPGTNGATELTEKDLDVIDRVSGVKDLSYVTIANAKVEFNKETRYFQVAGFPLDRGDVFLENGFYKIDEGRFLREGDIKSVGLGSQFKGHNLFGRDLKIGDRIIINDVTFTTRSILQSVGNPQDDKLILMSIDDLREVFNITSRIDQIIVQVDEGQDVKEVAERVEKRLLSTRGLTEKTKDFSIFTPETLLATFGVILNILTGFLLGVGAISIIVGGIGVVNTMYTSVLERTKEIGVMKAVGARNSDILILFTIESGLLGFLGGAIGVILGLLISKIIQFIAANQLGTSILQAATPAYLIFGCLVFAFVIGAASGTFPARHASQIKPVKALRYE